MKRERILPPEPEPGAGTEGLDSTLADLEAARAGDQEAADRLWRRYSGRLVPAVRLRLGSRLRQRLETMDIVQSVFLEAVTASEEREFGSEGQFRSWLSRLVENRIRSKARFYGREKRRVDRERRLSPEADEALAEDEDLLPEALAAERDERERLEQALDLLPASLREILLLRYFDELSHREIGERYGKSEEAARKMVQRAVDLLAREVRRLGAAG